MTFLGNGGQPRDAQAFVQAWRTVARCVIAAGLAGLGLAGLGGCADHHTSGPEAWWHDAIGGKIAEERPPPPGDQDPFPNLSTVPARPAATDTQAWTRMTAGLTSDRLNALQAAALAPIPPASAPAAAAGAPKTQPAANQPEPGASAALAGVSPPASKPESGKTAPLMPPTAAQIAAPPNPAGAAERVANGQLPALPIQPPERPSIAPPPPPPAVPATAMAPLAAPGDGTGIDFSRGSAALTDADFREVKSLAGLRGDRGIAITGYGDASTSDASAQSDAVALGLLRAQAVATALVAQGVPYARLRLSAEAAGRGASLRLLQ